MCGLHRAHGAYQSTAAASRTLRSARVRPVGGTMMTFGEYRGRRGSAGRGTPSGRSSRSLRSNATCAGRGRACGCCSVTLPWTPTSLALLRALLAFELPLAFELELRLDGRRELRVSSSGRSSVRTTRPISRISGSRSTAACCAGVWAARFQRRCSKPTRSAAWASWPSRLATVAIKAAHPCAPALAAGLHESGQWQGEGLNRGAVRVAFTSRTHLGPDVRSPASPRFRGR